MASLARVEIICARGEGERFVIACEVLSGAYGGAGLDIDEPEPDRTEQFGDGCVICAASATVEDCEGATLAHAHACVRQHMSTARTCMHAHMVAQVHTRAHAKEGTYMAAHTARTREIGNPHPPGPCLTSLIYHRRLQMRWFASPRLPYALPPRAGRLCTCAMPLGQ